MTAGTRSVGSRPRSQRPTGSNAEGEPQAPAAGLAEEDPCPEDLERNDFVVITELTRKDATDADFMQRFAKLCKTYGPVVRFLCDALELPF